MRKAFLFAAVLLPLALRLHAGTPPRLALARSTGLSLTGTVSTVYTIQSTANPASLAAWKCFDFVQATNSSTLIPDSLPNPGQNLFFRAAEMPAPTNMVFVPAGSFLLGSPNAELGRYSDEGPQTAVVFTRGLFISKFLVTQGDYLSVVGVNPTDFPGDLTRPVDRVSWQNATNYCRLLTLRELNAGRIPPGSEYRLPTEPEWERACRAGSLTRFYFGDDPNYTSITNYGWFSDNSDSMTHAVGAKLPNAWGLYDMAGNVWQWCSSWYSDAGYPGGTVTNYAGPATGVYRVLRGGSWADDAPLCRSACRSYDLESGALYDNYGFRVVLAPAP